eukprot:97667_1
MKHYHTILSIFTSTSHTNYSSRQRILCCYMYLMTICACSALFYGQKKESFIGQIILMLWSSLFTCLPVYCIIYLFQFSRPKIKKSKLKKAILNTKIFDAPMYKLNDSDFAKLDLEMTAKWFVSEFGAYEYNQKQLIDKNYNRPNIGLPKIGLPKIMPTMIEMQSYSKVSTSVSDHSNPPSNPPSNHSDHGHNIINEKPIDIKNRLLINAQHIIRTERIRKRLVKSEYPFPYCCKTIAWCMLIIWCILCCCCIIFYGAHFDLTYKVCSTQQNTYNYMQCAEKSNYLLDNNINNNNITRRILAASSAESDDDDEDDEQCYFKQE